MLTAERIAFWIEVMKLVAAAAAAFTALYGVRKWLAPAVKNASGAMRTLAMLPAQVATGFTAVHTNIDNLSSAMAQTIALTRANAAQQPNPVWEASPEGEYTYVNDAWVEVAGLESVEAMGWGWVNALLPSDHARVLAEWELARKQHRSYYSDHRYLCRETSQITILRVEVHPTLGRNREIIGYVGVGKVLTNGRAAKVAEQLQRQSGSMHLREVAG